MGEWSSLNRKSCEARPAHRGIERAADGQDAVAQFLGVEPLAVHPPEPSVVGVDAGGGRVVARRLAIDGAGDDQPMDRLERLAAVAQLDGQPVEQLRMRRLRAVAAEVVGRVHQSPAEVIVPDAVDDRSPGQHVGGAGDPLGQRGTAAPFLIRRGGPRRSGRGPGRTTGCPARRVRRVARPRPGGGRRSAAGRGGARSTPSRRAAGP